MAPFERLNVGLELTRMSRDLLAQGIRARHPEYSDDEVKWAVIAYGGRAFAVLFRRGCRF